MIQLQKQFIKQWKWYIGHNLFNEIYIEYLDVCQFLSLEFFWFLTFILFCQHASIQTCLLINGLIKIKFEMSVYMYIFGEMFLMIFLSLITPCVNTPFILTFIHNFISIYWYKYFSLCHLINSCWWQKHRHVL